MMKNSLHSFCILLVGVAILVQYSVDAQNVGINSTGSNPDGSAVLDVNSTDRGMLLPRMTTSQRDNISSAATGLIIYNTDCNVLNYYNGSTWIAIGNTGGVNTPGSITGNATPCLNEVGVTYSITAVSGASGYNWTVPSGSVITAGQGTTGITVTMGSTNGNVCVSAYDACGSSIASCQTITLAGNITAPTAGTHTPSQTQIVWNWNAVAGATGYKYNTVNNYSTATDNMTNVTHTQTGLTCNTPYALYVWSYDACGNSTALTLNETTTSCCSPSVTALGGLTQTTTCVGAYTVVQWTGVSSESWTVPTGVTSIEYIVIAGGGGGGGYWCGGGCSGGIGGGGGAGGYRSSVSGESSGGGASAESPLAVTGGSSLTVTVGAGGAGGGNFANGTNGSNSTFGSITSTGGGGGGALDAAAAPQNGNAGGSGGGGSQAGGLGAASSPVSPVQGYAGGNSGGGGFVGGGGGGGAGSVGQNSPTVSNGGAGGAGVSSSITGSATFYAAGGAAGSHFSQPASLGGSGIGGNGGVHWDATAPTAGTANTGSGGGGAAGTVNNGAAGGSGTIIIRYIE